MNVSYFKLYKCQQIAEEANRYWMDEYNELPTNVIDAEIAVRKAYEKGCFSLIESWEFVEKYMELIVDQIGFIVEAEDDEMD